MKYIYNDRKLKRSDFEKMSFKDLNDAVRQARESWYGWGETYEEAKKKKLPQSLIDSYKKYMKEAEEEYRIGEDVLYHARTRKDLKKWNPSRM